MIEKPKICKNCSNFIKEDDNGNFSCDADYWEKEQFIQAILNIPEMYGCNEFEYFILDE